MNSQSRSLKSSCSLIRRVTQKHTSLTLKHCVTSTTTGLSLNLFIFIFISTSEDKDEEVEMKMLKIWRCCSSSSSSSQHFHLNIFIWTSEPLHLHLHLHLNICIIRCNCAARLWTHRMNVLLESPARNELNVTNFPFRWTLFINKVNNVFALYFWVWVWL